MKTYEEEAQELLKHYLELLFKANGLQWDSDNAYETDQIVTLIMSEIRGSIHRLSGKLERLESRIDKVETTLYPND